MRWGAPIGDVDMRGRRVLVRVDMNVPMHNGKVADAERIRAHVPTLKHVLSRGAQARLVSHMGRPQEGVYDADLSLAPVAEKLAEMLGEHVAFLPRLEEASADAGSVVMYENIRFQCGESLNDERLAQRLAALCDIFVMDAFGSAHRSHASTCGVARFAPVVCMGQLMSREITALTRLMNSPKRPFLAIVGGAKTETKIGVLETLSRFADELIPAGAIANTLLAAQGVEVGRSLCDKAYFERASLMGGAQILLPKDFICAPELSGDADTVVRSVNQVGADEMIGDVGPQTREMAARAVSRAATILWNGPLGAFERSPFAGGTAALAKAIAQSQAYVVAGGGDTIAAIHRFGVDRHVAHISTGGGSMLEFIQSGDLPVLKVIRDRRAA